MVQPKKSSKVLTVEPGYDVGIVLFMEVESFRNHTGDSDQARPAAERRIGCLSE